MSLVMNKLICSFKSDLPNEIDFALQVATILANTDNFTWSKDYPLVDAICSSLHVFTCVCENDSPASCYCYPRFWHKVLNSSHAENPYLQAATVPTDTEQPYLNFSTLKDHDSDDHNKIYRRIRTTAELIKQFSMTCDISSETEKSETENYSYNYHQIKKKKLKASPSLLKFVSLLLNCDDTPLNLIGLDILSNTASKLSKIPEMTGNYTSGFLVQMFQEQCVENINCLDGDIYVIVRSIEVVSRLISSSDSKVSLGIINLMNEKNLLLRLEQLLTSRNDVNLFLATLECCYRISRYQPHLISTGRAQHLIKILVNLLNCEDKQFFTQNALKRIKLVESEDSSDKSYDLDSKNIVQVNHATNPITTSTSSTATATTTTSTTSSSTSTTTSTSAPTTTSTTTAPTPTIAITKNPTINISINNSSNINNIKCTQPSLPNVNSIATNHAPAPIRETVKENGSSTTNHEPTPPTVQQAPPAKEYSCEWDNCNIKFGDPKLVYTHVFEVHIRSLAPDVLSPCLWSSPNGSGPGCQTKRPKYSLLTHLNDFHCNPSALERRLTLSEPVRPPLHPGYGPNAALLAIKRHANSEKNITRAQENSPLSVSVRLTAALILRNLASDSSEMKRALENHEPLLSEICMTNGRDESKIIAECLSLFSNEN